MRTRIKICGVTESAIAKTAAASGADAIGLVFADGSPRQITADQAASVLAGMPPFVEVVALFVNATSQYVRWTTDALGIRTVQLHGDETPDYVADLHPLRVIKTIGFRAGIKVEETLAPWRGSVNLVGLLFDAAPTIGQPRGGSGRTIDWRALASLRQQGALDGLPPVVLAGGLTTQNVSDAIRIVRPYAVDVSSGVETSPGMKSPQLIRTFCHAVRHAQTEP